MWRVYDCIVADHNYFLVFVAAAICLFGSATTFVIAERTQDPRHRVKWLVAVALSSGATVWSTHFVAMLAFHQDLPAWYAAAPTIGSLLAGIVGIGAGFVIAIMRAGNATTALAGGTVAGAGVVSLHYLGMSAINLPGRIAFDADLVILSITFSLVFGALAFFFAFGHDDDKRRRLPGIAFFVLMVVSLHFTAMGAVVIEPGPWKAKPPSELSRDMLAILVAIITSALLAIALAGALFDRRRTAALLAQAQRFRVLSDSALEGLVIHRNGLVIDSNEAARRLLDFDSAAEFPSIYDWFGDVPRSQVDQWLTLPLDAPVEVDLQGCAGRQFTAEVCGTHLQLPDGKPGQVLAMRDVTTRKQMEARLHHQALHDPLTDLPNRRLFGELAEKVRSRAERHQESFAILMLDLDNFKTVNDLHGHNGGDHLLVKLAERIENNLRESDIVARLGGDEFAIIATGTSQPHDSAQLAERIIEQISGPVEIDGGEAIASVSIGIAVYPDDGTEIDALMRNADTAMYGAKAEGKGTFLFFEPRMNRALEARRQLESRLRKAVENGTLTVAYQPLVESGSRRAMGFEALVRWNDESLGNVPPSDFIPVAEESGLIIPLGEHVLRTACRDAAGWPEPLHVSVNLSAIQFRRAGLADTVKRILDETGLSGERLDLEITESILIENRAMVLETLYALKALGISISMDDFGTGYSSLSYLQSFPFDKIKIDKVFVSDLETNAQNTSIVRAVTAMGHSLDITVVAEGVETDTQATKLAEMHCDELQGYLIARPMRADQVAGFLRGPLAVAKAS